MNTTLKATAIAFLTLFAQLAHADVEITAKLIEASPDITITPDLALLNQKRGVELLASPRVTAKSGNKTVIRLTKDFQIEGQEAIPVGIELEITTEQTPSGLKYLARYKRTEFEGFSDPATKQRPVFRTISIPFNGSAQDNVPILIEAGNKHDPSIRCYIHLTFKNV